MIDCSFLREGANGLKMERSMLAGAMTCHATQPLVRQRLPQVEMNSAERAAELSRRTDACRWKTTSCLLFYAILFKISHGYDRQCNSSEKQVFVSNSGCYDSVCSVPECPGDMTQDSIVKPMLALPRLALPCMCVARSMPAPPVPCSH